MTSRRSAWSRPTTPRHAVALPAGPCLRLSSHREPGKISLVDDWDMIPGRALHAADLFVPRLFAELKGAGASTCFGLSTQSKSTDRNGITAALAVSGAIRREAGADACAEAADHGSGGLTLINGWR